MINEQELEIANTSYTNKDFGVIYTEILDLARKLSSLWKPQSSNESDPGVVLLKLLAFMGDKLNYNIDKNALENFMISATQENSMRKLCDMMGYYMNYYRSAVTPITFTYKGTKLNLTAEDESRNIKYLTFPKYRTVITNEDASLQYILWGNVESGDTGDITLNTNRKTSSALAIEGYLNTVNVGDSDKITLENLDSQNRLYFGEKQVAQNGILIRAYGSGDSEQADAEGEFWKRVENLNVQDPGAKVYKFGYDSKRGLPYVEFPTDIANIIEDGLLVRYVVTSGYYGNVGVGNLNTLLSPTKRTITKTIGEPEEITFTDEGNSELLIKNNSAAVNGANPEDIDSAYNNFKKTVGTFQTLVTCRDFANYIYTSILNPGTGNPLVSNIQVSDRRTDLNHSRNVTTYSELGATTRNLSSDFSKLFLYPLTGINNPMNDSEYKQSFKLANIKDDIESYFRADDSVANVSYDYVNPSPSDIALIKILYNLDAKITTTYKVNVAEQLDIKKNIYNSLRNKFYSRNVDYGYEIPFENIYNCIMNADSRIKSVSLKEPEHTVKYFDFDNEELPLCGTSDNDYKDSPYLKLLSKNVLSGKLPMFEYDNRFTYEFGMGTYEYEDGNWHDDDQEETPILENVESVTSEVKKTLSTNNTELRTNEVIQLIGPKLADEVEYGTYINFYYKTDSNNPHNIEPNVDTTLLTNDKLLLVYNDTSQNQVEILYEEGDIIRSTFEITPTDESSSSKVTKRLKDAEIISKLGQDVVGCLGIGTNQSIVKRSVVRHEFNSTIECAWLVNEDVTKNVLWTKFGDPVKPATETSPAVYEYILGDSDYFIYSLDESSSYEIFGSGTSIRLSLWRATPQDIFPGTCDIPNLNDLYNNGIESIEGILKTVPISTSDTLTVQVNEILTLTVGDVIQLGEGASSIEVDNDWQKLDEPLRYRLVDDTNFINLPPKQISEDIYDNWRIRSRLDIVVGPDFTQSLLPGQSVTFYKDYDPVRHEYNKWYTLVGGHDDEGEIVNKAKFRTNIALDIAGGSDINLSLIDPNSLLTGVSYPLSVLVYADDEEAVTDIRRINNYVSYNIVAGEINDSPFGEREGHTGCSVLHIDDEEMLFMLFIRFVDNPSISSSTNITISAKDSNGAAVEIEDYATGDVVNQIDFESNTSILHTLKLSSDVAKVMLTTNSDTVVGTVKIGLVRNIEGLNSRFNLEALEEEFDIVAGDLSTALKSLIKEDGSDDDDVPVFNYTAVLDKSEEIEEEDLLSSFALFDKNNIANKFVMSYIDLDNSSIEITRSSKL